METEFFLKRRKCFLFEETSLPSPFWGRQNFVSADSAGPQGHWSLCYAAWHKGKSLDLLRELFFCLTYEIAVRFVQKCFCAVSVCCLSLFSPCWRDWVNLRMKQASHTCQNWSRERRHLNQSTHPGNPRCWGELWTSEAAEFRALSCLHLVSGTEALSSNWASY